MTSRKNCTKATDVKAADVRCSLDAQSAAWGTRSWTRRRFVAGAGMAGVAALGSQFVTARGAFAAQPATTDRTVVVVFLRGAADGLRLLVPTANALGGEYLRSVRGPLVPPASQQIPLNDGWGLNRAMRPLYDTLWKTGEMAFVPAVSSQGITRSHFQAQQHLERGGSDTARSGWLDRVLDQVGPGTTFRAMNSGTTTPLSMVGGQQSLTVPLLRDMTFPGWSRIQAASEDAVRTLYRGLDNPLAQDVPAAIEAVATAGRISRTAAARRPSYPQGNFARSLRDIAATLQAEVGLQVATVDVGGWDTHTDEAADFDQLLSGTALALRSFMTDLGPVRRRRVTVVVMTEFGRRVAMNASGGTDHGHGGVMWLLGGGLTGSGVRGAWTPLSKTTLDQGDVRGLNSPYDVLSEVVTKRLNVGSGKAIFPGQQLSSLNVVSRY